MTLRILTGIAVVLAAGGAALAQDIGPDVQPVRDITPVSTSAADFSDSISVALDFAKLMRVPSAATTLVLGNPTIADATIQKNGLIVVTGKSYGTTNLLALDSNGETLHEMQIHVTARQERTLTVLRGTSRETWSCAPRCEQTVTLGDSSEFFGGNSGQVTSRNGLATQR